MVETFECAGVRVRVHGACVHVAVRTCDVCATVCLDAWYLEVELVTWLWRVAVVTGDWCVPL